MSPEWETIEAARGFQGVRAIVERDLRPALETAPAEILDKGGAPKVVGGWAGAAFTLTVALFISVTIFLPESEWSGAITFIALPVLFLGSIALIAFLKRKSIIAYFLRAETRFATRAQALRSVAEHLGLEYVPMPGGPPAALAVLATFKWAPKELRQLVERLQQQGGMDAPLAIARASGLMQNHVTVLGTKETRRKFREQEGRNLEIEDGFRGVRSGIAFDMFERIERVEDSPTIHHLIIVMAAPIRLEGVTQLRSRGVAWPQAPEDMRLDAVSLETPDFEKHFRLRANDQVESRALFNPAVIERVLALATQGKFRAVASGDHLVFAFQGTDRFALLDLQTGAWSEDTIRKGLADLAEALALVDALAHAFMLRAKG